MSAESAEWGWPAHNVHCVSRVGVASSETVALSALQCIGLLLN